MLMIILLLIRLLLKVKPTRREESISRQHNFKSGKHRSIFNIRPSVPQIYRCRRNNESCTRTNSNEREYCKGKIRQQIDRNRKTSLKHQEQKHLEYSLNKQTKTMFLSSTKDFGDIENKKRKIIEDIRNLDPETNEQELERLNDLIEEIDIFQPENIADYTRFLKAIKYAPSYFTFRRMNVLIYFLELPMSDDDFDALVNFHFQSGILSEKEVFIFACLVLNITRDEKIPQYYKPIPKNLFIEMKKHASKPDFFEYYVLLIADLRKIDGNLENIVACLDENKMLKAYENAELFCPEVYCRKHQFKVLSRYRMANETILEKFLNFNLENVHLDKRLYVALKIMNDRNIFPKKLFECEEKISWFELCLEELHEDLVDKQKYKEKNIEFVQKFSKLVTLILERINK